METSSYYEILHRAIRQDRSLLRFTSPDDIEVLENTPYGSFFDIYCTVENQPAFVVHCHDSISDFDCNIEWIN